MRTIAAARIDSDDLERVESVAKSLPESEFADALLAMFDDFRSGEDICVAKAAEGISPAAAARLLGMSRAHLYKLLDAGEIPQSRVGRDRRIAMSDLTAYKARRDEESKQLAERFAHPERVDAAARDAIADLLD
jgi:excisionase family DNA binding protein